jgi:hypothetical protein
VLPKVFGGGPAAIASCRVACTHPWAASLSRTESQVSINSLVRSRTLPSAAILPASPLSPDDRFSLPDDGVAVGATSKPLNHLPNLPRPPLTKPYLLRPAPKKRQNSPVSTRPQKISTTPRPSASFVSKKPRHLTGGEGGFLGAKLKLPSFLQNQKHPACEEVSTRRAKRCGTGRR